MMIHGFNADKFKSFLTLSGAEVLEPTNQYEVVRFKTVNSVSVVYGKKNGRLTFTGESQEAFDAMKAKNVWTILPRGVAEKMKRLDELVERDGPDCFYCGVETDKETRSIEHILSVTHGGNNNLANLAIACRECNHTVGDMPVIDKVAYREQRRANND